MKIFLNRNKKRITNNVQSLTEMSRQMNPIFEVKAGSDLEKQLNMIDLSKEDFAVAQTLMPYVQEDIKEIVNEF